jgi:hypothetical protein
MVVALGLMWVVGGVVASVACSGLALGAGTGRFVIATGAIGVGFAAIVRGLKQSRHR